MSHAGSKTSLLTLTLVLIFIAWHQGQGQLGRSFHLSVASIFYHSVRTASSLCLIILLLT